MNTTVTVIKAFGLDKTDEILFSVVNNSDYFSYSFYAVLHHY